MICEVTVDAQDFPLLLPMVEPLYLQIVMVLAKVSWVILGGDWHFLSFMHDGWSSILFQELKGAIYRLLRKR